MFLNKYIFSYDEVISILDSLTKTNSNIHKMDSIGKSYYGYDIPYYTIGNGNLDVILIAGTHGNELVTVTYIMNLIQSLLNSKSYLKKYTFHILPIINPEGYIISSSNVIHNTKNMNKKEFENYSKKYLKLYTIDDLNVEKGLKKEKEYKKLMISSTEFIDNIFLRKSVENILKNTNLDSSVLAVWQTNGKGIDINSNSIHEFENMRKLRNIQEYGKMRYNDIAVYIPSPNSYPGKEIFDKDVPENIALYNFVNKIYSKGNLKLFLSYHSTGAQIYGYPNINKTKPKQIDLILNGMYNYRHFTNYDLINEKYKYGVMDYYRIALDKVITLTIELSKINGNPIGPFSNLENLQKEFNDNTKAMLYTLDKTNI
ncbi:MAG: M14 family zinc carboxypeptidase [Clostridia bacterium]